MFQATCIEKIRDENNNIIGYKIIGKDKKPISVKSESLKKAIKSGQLEVTNITLTSDNRLINKKPVTSLKQINNIESLLNRVKSLGYTLNTFDTACGHKCYIASSMDHLKHWFIIPDDVKCIYDQFVQQLICYGDSKIYEYMSNIEGALKVVGGKNLISTECMFDGCVVQSIDLSSFNTSNVTNMYKMFYHCKAHSLDLSSFNTSNVTNMKWMFEDCKAQSIDLSSFDTSKVTDMHSMFHGCKVQSLDLSSFNTSKVKDMDYMFANCEAQSINLTSFNTSKITNMQFMFSSCGAQSIDLSSFDTSKVTNMAGMFEDCKAQSLDLRSFNTSSVTDMRRMFRECKAQSIDLSSFNTRNVTKMKEMFCGCEAQIKINDAKLKAQLQSDRR